MDPLYAYPGQTNILDQIAEIEAQEIVNDEIVTYTDPAGNTFEAPVVTESFMDQLEEAMVEKQEEENEFIETQLYTAEEQEPFAWEGNSITPTPEDHIALEKETAVEKELVFEEETDDDAFFNFDLDFKDDDDSNGSNLFL